MIDRLSANFTVAELVRSGTAHRLGIDNTPPADVLPALRETAALLQRIRDWLQVPIIVTSAYRCPALNTAIGSRRTSDHITGQAADIVAPAFGTPYALARHLAPRVASLGIGQIILEAVGGKTWVHVSTRVPDLAANRVITITSAGIALGIQPVEA